MFAYVYGMYSWKKKERERGLNGEGGYYKHTYVQLLCQLNWFSKNGAVRFTSSTLLVSLRLVFSLLELHLLIAPLLIK